MRTFIFIAIGLPANRPTNMLCRSADLQLCRGTAVPPHTATAAVANVHSASLNWQLPAEGTTANCCCLRTQFQNATACCCAPRPFPAAGPPDAAIYVTAGALHACSCFASHTPAAATPLQLPHPCRRQATAAAPTAVPLLQLPHDPVSAHIHTYSDVTAAGPHPCICNT